MVAILTRINFIIFYIKSIVQPSFQGGQKISSKQLFRAELNTRELYTTILSEKKKEEVKEQTGKERVRENRDEISLLYTCKRKTGYLDALR